MQAHSKQSETRDREKEGDTHTKKRENGETTRN